eukprot:scaffold272299_cov37-Tisochrysis_lutea.AAC.2
MTIVHGDAKDANVVFGGRNRLEAQVYDFQYIGKASAAKDVAYALCCASDDPSVELRLIDFYYGELSGLLRAQGDEPPSQQTLRDSLALAYADLGRWMSGWGWWGHDLRHKIEPLLDQLDGGKILATEEEYAEAIAREFPLD